MAYDTEPCEPLRPTTLKTVQEHPDPKFQAHESYTLTPPTPLKNPKTSALEGFDSLAVTGHVGDGEGRRMWIVNDNEGYQAFSYETRLIPLRAPLD